MSNKTTKTIKYVGPKDETELSDYLVVEGFRLPKGAPVVVPESVAKEALANEDHEVVEAKGDEAKDAPDAQHTTGVVPVDEEPEAPSAGPGATEPNAAQ